MILAKGVSCSKQHKFDQMKISSVNNKNIPPKSLYRKSPTTGLLYSTCREHTYVAYNACYSTTVVENSEISAVGA